MKMCCIVGIFSDKIGYLYLTPRVHHSSNDYSPYNLKVVAYDEVRPDNYCTISAHGVTQVRNGEQTFTELMRWRKEYRLVSLLMGMLLCFSLGSDTSDQFSIKKASLL